MTSDHELEPRLPQWWSADIDAAWRRSREAAVDDWGVHVAHSDRAPIDRAIVEHALAFGHGARSAFPACETWDAVAATLHADWTRLGNTGTASWDTVIDLVRHEWERAAGPSGDAAPETSSPS